MDGAGVEKIARVISAELSWLAGELVEPEWPLLAPRPASPRYGSSRVPEGALKNDRNTLTQRTDTQAAALWLENAATIFDVEQRAWLRDVAKAYSGWTSIANGSELPEDEEADNTPRDWNAAFFKLLAHCVPGLSRTEIDEIALTPILKLPEQSFLDVMAIFLGEIDVVYFNEKTLHSDEAAYVRMTLAERLIKTRAWNAECRSRSDSISLHLGPATATMFFNYDGGWSQPPHCYLSPSAIERTQPFAPILQKVVESGPFIYVTMVLLNLLEVAPNPAHLPLIRAAARVWSAANPRDTHFWIGLSVGRRICLLIEAIRVLDPAAVLANQTVRNEIDALLARLIVLGVPEAYRLEEALRKNE